MSFTWAGQMRFQILGIIGLLILVAGMSVVFAFVYKAPSCTDQKQNQDEQGVDCGGSCTYLCTVQVSAPLEQFTRVLVLPNGRTDVIAKIQNPNKSAFAKAVPYTIELYSNDALVLARIYGTIDLPAGATVPIYIRAATQGSVVARAFTSINAKNIVWQYTEQVPAYPRVTEEVLVTGDMPRITARLINDTFTAMYGVHAVAVLYDATDSVLAASETLVPVLLSQSDTAITFTWNNAFTVPVARFEILPIIQLP